MQGCACREAIRQAKRGFRSGVPKGTCRTALGWSCPRRVPFPAQCGPLFKLDKNRGTKLVESTPKKLIATAVSLLEGADVFRQPEKRRLVKAGRRRGNRGLSRGDRVNGTDTDGKQELAGVWHEPSGKLLVFGNPKVTVELRPYLGAGLALHRRRVGGELGVTISLSSARSDALISSSLSVTGSATGTLSPYCSITSSTHLRNALATGVRANIARRWQPRKLKMRVSCGPPSVGNVTTAVIAGVNSSAWRV